MALKLTVLDNINIVSISNEENTQIKRQMRFHWRLYSAYSYLEIGCNAGYIILSGTRSIPRHSHHTERFYLIFILLEGRKILNLFGCFLLRSMIAKI